MKAKRESARAVVMKFYYHDLTKLTGIGPRNISRHRHYGSFAPDDLGSVACFLARYGNPELRQKMLAYAIAVRPAPLVKSTRKKQVPKKKADVASPAEQGKSVRVVDRLSNA